MTARQTCPCNKAGSCRRPTPNAGKIMPPNPTAIAADGRHTISNVCGGFMNESSAAYTPTVRSDESAPELSICAFCNLPL